MQPRTRPLRAAPQPQVHLLQHQVAHDARLERDVRQQTTHRLRERLFVCVVAVLRREVVVRRFRGRGGRGEAGQEGGKSRRLPGCVCAVLVLGRVHGLDFYFGGAGTAVEVVERRLGDG